MECKVWSVEWQTVRLQVTQRREDGLHLCTVLLDIKSGVIYVLSILDVVHKSFPLLQDRAMRIIATAVLATTTASPCNEKKRERVMTMCKLNVTCIRVRGFHLVFQLVS